MTNRTDSWQLVTSNPTGRWTQEDDTWWWQGDCPACGHSIDRQLGKGFAGIRRRDEQDLEQLKSVTIRCNCNLTAEHPADLVERLKQNGIHATNSGCGYESQVPTPWAGSTPQQPGGSA